MSVPVLPLSADPQNSPRQLPATRSPTPLSSLLESLLHQLASGQAVPVATLDQEITTQQAAARLNISRTDLVKLVEEGHLSPIKGGPRGRFYREDVLAYQEGLEGGALLSVQAVTDELQDLETG